MAADGGAEGLCRIAACALGTPPPVELEHGVVVSAPEEAIILPLCVSSFSATFIAT
jgi:hypothetical protein